MKKLTDILEDFTLESVENDFRINLKLVEDFGHLVAEKSVLSDIQLQEIDYQLKYRGSLNDIFYLSIGRIFLVKIQIKDESGQESLFERKLALKGIYHLKNAGNGEVEVLFSSPYSKFGNSIRKYYLPDETAQPDPEFQNFLPEEFMMEA